MLHMEDTPAWLKALAAAFAGRALLLLDVQRYVPISWRTVVTVAVWEIPLIIAFALLGWYGAELLGFSEDNGRVVVVALLANLGARGLDRLVARLLPRPPGPDQR